MTAEKVIAVHPFMGDGEHKIAALTSDGRLFERKRDNRGINYHPGDSVVPNFRCGARVRNGRAFEASSALLIRFEGKLSIARPRHVQPTPSRSNLPSHAPSLEHSSPGMV